MVKYTVYKLHNGCSYRMMPYRKERTSFTDYKDSINSSISVEDGEDIDDILDDIFLKEDVAVSDIVAVCVKESIEVSDNTYRYYYCNLCGWVDITDTITNK